VLYWLVRVAKWKTMGEEFYKLEKVFFILIPIKK
jgi:hypothetical protein